MKFVIPLYAVAVLAPGAAIGQAPGPPPPAGSVAAQRVEGLGGFFFKAKDPKALAAWYAANLGVTKTPTEYHQEPWRQSAGPTVFQPFPSTSKLFERPEQSFVLNFRVKDLDAMAAQLRRAGAAVEVDPQTYPNGRFALTHDPEGNPIQLWEPNP